MTPTTAAAIYDELSLSGLRLFPIALILLVGLPLAGFLGYALGGRQRSRLMSRGKEPASIIGDTTFNAFQALLGLLLAFSFGNSLTIALSQKAAITGEAAALGTAFLRADYIPEPARTDLQQALLDYARTRVIPAGLTIGSSREAQAFLETSLTAQARLWPLTVVGTRDVPTDIQVMVAASVNAVLDAHLYRIASLSVPVASFTHSMLLFAALGLVFVLGNRAGMLGLPLTWRDLIFTLFLCAVMYSIVDIRRGSEGLMLADDSTLRATIFDMVQALKSR